MVDNAYALVIRGLPKAKRQALEVRHGHGALYPNTDPQGRKPAAQR
jgi:hypothetical protein